MPFRVLRSMTALRAGAIAVIVASRHGIARGIALFALLHMSRLPLKYGQAIERASQLSSIEHSCERLVTLDVCCFAPTMV